MTNKERDMIKNLEIALARVDRDLTELKTHIRWANQYFEAIKTLFASDSDVNKIRRETQ